MEPPQIQRSLFEDSGGEIFPARFVLVIVDNVHVIVIWLVTSFSSVRRSTFQQIPDCVARISRRRCLLLAVIVLPMGLAPSGRIETEQ